MEKPKRSATRKPDPLFDPCPEGTIYLCMACGKTSMTGAPTELSGEGWDESCMLNRRLVMKEKLNGEWVAVGGTRDG